MDRWQRRVATHCARDTAIATPRPSSCTMGIGRGVAAVTTRRTGTAYAHAAAAAPCVSAPVRVPGLRLRSIATIAKRTMATRTATLASAPSAPQEAALPRPTATVKPYDLHVLLCTDVPPARWPHGFEAARSEAARARTTNAEPNPNLNDEDASARTLTLRVAHLSHALNAAHVRGALAARLMLTVVHIDEAASGERRWDVQPGDVLLAPSLVRFRPMTTTTALVHVHDDDALHVRSWCDEATSFVVDECARDAASSTTATTLHSRNILRLHTPAHAPAPAHSHRLALVCAHGTRDARCALHGPPMIAALRAHAHAHAHAATASPPSTLHAYACSHIGGHIYAGNVIFYPHGDWFGNVRADSVVPLLDRYVSRRATSPTAVASDAGNAGDAQPTTTPNDHIDFALWRGRIGLSKDEQRELCAHCGAGNACIDG